MKMERRGASKAVLIVAIAILVLAAAIAVVFMIRNHKLREEAARNAVWTTQSGQDDSGWGDDSSASDSGPAEVARKLVEAIKSGDMVGAEDYLTGHGKTVSIEHGMNTYEGVHREIQGDLEADGVDGWSVYFDYDDTQISGRTARVPFGLSHPRQKTRWYIVLANDGGEWKVDNVEF